MAIASVTEWRGALIQNNAVTQVPRGLLNNQNVTFTTSTAMDAPMLPRCGIVQLISDTDCYWEMGVAPTATTDSTYLPAGIAFFLAGEPGQKIAFVAK